MEAWRDETMKLNVEEYGTQKKEKKDETETIHKLVVGDKETKTKLTIRSWDKSEMDKIKQSGQYTINPNEVRINVKVEFKIKKEKYEKDTDNVIQFTGNPWFTLKISLEELLGEEAAAKIQKEIEKKVVKVEFA
jgi:hypothetical protein